MNIVEALGIDIVDAQRETAKETAAKVQRLNDYKDAVGSISSALYRFSDEIDTYAPFEQMRSKMVFMSLYEQINLISRTLYKERAHIDDDERVNQEIFRVTRGAMVDKRKVLHDNEVVIRLNVYQDNYDDAPYGLIYRVDRDLKKAYLVIAPGNDYKNSLRIETALL